MKNKICLIILFCVVLITVCATSFVLIEKKNISKHNLVYASGIDNKLYEYNLSELDEKQISFDGYSDYFLVGEYTQGDYCCVAKDENSAYFVLTVKDGIVEKVYQLSFCPDKIIVGKSNIYCLSEGKIYLISTTDNSEILYKENVYTEKYCLSMFVTEQENLVYLRQENDESVSALLDSNGQESNIFTFNLKEASIFGLDVDGRILYIDRIDNNALKSVSVYGGKLNKVRKYGKDVTSVQSMFDGEFVIKYKIRIIDNCPYVFVDSGKTGVSVVTGLPWFDVPDSVVVV